MRFWPREKWKQIMLLLVLILVSTPVAVGAFAVLLLSTSREVVSGIDVINADGSKARAEQYTMRDSRQI